MAHSAAEDSSSRPLIPQVPSNTLSPDVVQRPLTLPAQGYRDDDDGDDSKGRWTLDIITIARSIVIILSLANFITQCVSIAQPGILDFLRVFSMIIMVLNIVALVLRFFKNHKIGSSNTTSELSIVIGNRKFYVWGSDNDYETVGLHDGISPKKPSYFPGFWLVDVLITIILLITSNVGFQSSKRYGYRNNSRRDAIFILHFIVLVFEFVIAILQWSDDTFGQVAMVFKTHKDRRTDYEYRIQLPRDERPKQPMSAVA